MAKVSDDIRSKIDDETFEELFVATPIPTVEEIDEKEKLFRDKQNQESERNKRKLTWALIDLDRQLPDLGARRKQVEEAFNAVYAKRNSRAETWSAVFGVVAVVLGIVGFVCVLAYTISYLLTILGIALVAISLRCWAAADTAREDMTMTEELEVSLKDYPHPIPDEVASLVAHVHKKFYGCVSFRVKHTVHLSRTAAKELYDQKWRLGYEKQKLRGRQLLAEHPELGFPELSVTIEGSDCYTIAAWE